MITAEILTAITMYCSSKIDQDSCKDYLIHCVAEYPIKLGNNIRFNACLATYDKI